MKALTVRQPWASLIVWGIKRIETRSWRTHHRGPLVIHAGRESSRDTHTWAVAKRALAAAGLEWDLDRLPVGQVLGAVELVDVGRVNDLGTLLEKRKLIAPAGGEYEPLLGNYEGDGFGWLLDAPRAFECPIPARGRQGLWDVRDDIETAGNVDQMTIGDATHAAV